ncbi:MAG: hypothetical protein ABIY51_01575 [Ferruginibacter sp.]
MPIKVNTIFDQSPQLIGSMLLVEKTQLIVNSYLEQKTPTKALNAAKIGFAKG